jgi:hypothetical protein
MTRSIVVGRHRSSLTETRPNRKNMFFFCSFSEGAWPYSAAARPVPRKYSSTDSGLDAP